MAEAMITAASIERDMRREWGEAAMLEPLAFRVAVIREVCKIDEDGKRWRSVAINGTFGPHVSEQEYFPISCCAARWDRPFGVHEPDCYFSAPTLNALLAAGGVMSFPPDRYTAILDAADLKARR